MNNNRTKRDRGEGCLIPPRPRVSKYWSYQVYDQNGKPVRKSSVSGLPKITRTFKLGPDPDAKIHAENLRNPKNWTNLTAATTMLDKLRVLVGQGTIAVGNDPSSLRYADLRKMYLAHYKEKRNRSLRTNAAGEIYVDSLPHLDKFFGYENDGDMGAKVLNITVDRIDAFKAERIAAGTANGTINRSLSALGRMFKLAIRKQKIQFAPPIEKLPEGEPRQGFLEITDYDRLHAALPEYVRPLLQMGYYTGMRRGEILKLTWDRIDLAEEMITLENVDVKNKKARTIPLIDGLPETLEKIRRANPDASQVFLGAQKQEISSFRKAWAKACIDLEIKTNLYGVETVSHVSKGSECCACCIAKGEYDNAPVKEGEYVGFLFHDLRRSAVRNLIRAGVPRGIAMSISGHRNEGVFERYNITSLEDQQNAAKDVKKYIDNQRRQAKDAPNPMQRRLQIAK